MATPYADEYKKRMQGIFGSKNHVLSEKNSVSKASDIGNSDNRVDRESRENQNVRKFKELSQFKDFKQPVRLVNREERFRVRKVRDTSLLIVLVALFMILNSFLLFFYSDNIIVWVMVLILTVVGGFLFLVLIHKGYEKFLERIYPLRVVGLIYLFLILNMYLGMRLYSIEWAFLGFVVSAVVFYDSKIDSRFLIFPALLLLGYVPFLLIAKQSAFAETAAIYVYYFLVVGVGLQVIEHLKNTKNSVDFGSFIKRIIYSKYLGEYIIFIGIISGLIIVINRFREIELLKWTFIYIFSVILVFYGISIISKKEEWDEEKDY
jgi:hypothetical protein